MSLPERPNKYEFSPQEQRVFIALFNKGISCVATSTSEVAPFAAGINSGLRAGRTYPFPVLFERITDRISSPFQTYFTFANFSQTDETAITPAITMPVNTTMSENESVSLIAESLAGSLVYMQTFLSSEWSGLFETIVRQSLVSTAAYLRSSKTDFNLPEQSIQISNVVAQPNQHIDLTPLTEDTRILDIRLPGQLDVSIREFFTDEMFADCTLSQYTQAASSLLPLRRLLKINPGAYANLAFIADYPHLSLNDQEIVYEHFALEQWLKAKTLSTKLIGQYTYDTLEAKTPEEQQDLFARALLLELFNTPDANQRY